MKNQQENISAVAALLRSTSGVDTSETNSLCCAAAGIIALSSTTAEARIPQEKLRGAVLADATLTASRRPHAQPVVGYMHVRDPAKGDHMTVFLLLHLCADATRIHYDLIIATEALDCSSAYGLSDTDPEPVKTPEAA